MADPTPAQKDEALRALCAELAEDLEVTGIFLFGSHARGDARPDSDIDLLVVRHGPFEKRVFRRDGVEFELFVNNEEAIVAFWRANDDDFASFWADAQVLFDRDGATHRLTDEAERIRAQ